MQHGRRKSSSSKLHEAAWPDMFANLQTAYAELTQTQFELERRAAEIEDARDLFPTVIESMSEALFLLDCSGCIVRANPGAGALLETTEEHLAGKPFSEVCGPGQIPATPGELLERAPGENSPARRPKSRPGPAGLSPSASPQAW